MNQCASCSGWFGLTSWMCAACQQLAHTFARGNEQAGTH
jgi:hypothetical protein